MIFPVNDVQPGSPAAVAPVLETWGAGQSGDSDPTSNGSFSAAFGASLWQSGAVRGQDTPPGLQAGPGETAVGTSPAAVGTPATGGGSGQLASDLSAAIFGGLNVVKTGAGGRVAVPVSVFQPGAKASLDGETAADAKAPASAAFQAGGKSELVKAERSYESGPVEGSASRAGGLSGTGILTAKIGPAKAPASIGLPVEAKDKKQVSPSDTALPGEDNAKLAVGAPAVKGNSVQDLGAAIATDLIAGGPTGGRVATTIGRVAGLVQPQGHLSATSPVGALASSSLEGAKTGASAQGRKAPVGSLTAKGSTDLTALTGDLSGSSAAVALAVPVEGAVGGSAGVVLSAHPDLSLVAELNGSVPRGRSELGNAPRHKLDTALDAAGSASDEVAAGTAREVEGRDPRRAGPDTKLGSAFDLPITAAPVVNAPVAATSPLVDSVAATSTAANAQTLVHSAPDAAQAAKSQVSGISPGRTGLRVQAPSVAGTGSAVHLPAKNAGQALVCTEDKAVLQAGTASAPGRGITAVPREKASARQYGGAAAAAETSRAGRSSANERPNVTPNGARQKESQAGLQAESQAVEQIGGRAGGTTGKSPGNGSGDSSVEGARSSASAAALNTSQSLPGDASEGSGSGVSGTAASTAASTMAATHAAGGATAVASAPNGGAGVTAAAHPGTNPGTDAGSLVSELASATQVSKGVASAVNGAGLAGGSAARADLPAISQPHRTLLATPTTLEVGVPDGTQGWLKIRAEVGEQGQVNASLAAGSSVGQEMLHRELPALNAFLHSEQLSVTAAVTERSFTPGGAGQAGNTEDASRSMSANAGLGHAGTAGGGTPGGEAGDSSQRGTVSTVDAGDALRGYTGSDGGVGLRGAGLQGGPLDANSGRWLNVRA